MKRNAADDRNRMMDECMRQIFDARQGHELIGASRLARAIASRADARFDDLVMEQQTQVPVLK